MSTAAPHTDLRVGITYGQILKIALPISAAILVPQVNFITNNIFLSVLGEQTLAMAGITGVFYLIFAVVGMGLNSGLQMLISRRAGENKPGEIGKLFSQGVMIALFFAAAGIIIVYTIAPYILRMTLRSDTIAEQSIHFLKIRIWGLPFLYVYQMRNALLVGINQSKYLLAGTLAETLANIFLDYGLIYGHFGLPKLGFNGAAYASIMAEAIGLGVVFMVIYRKGFHKTVSLYKNFGIDKKTIKLILTQSSPLILQGAISIVSWEFFYILIEHHGDTALAVSNTMRNIFGFFGVFTWAFAATTNTMVSNVIGQGRKQDVLPLIYRIVHISTGFALLVCLVLNIFPEAFLSIYGRGDAFIREGLPVVRIVSAALVFMSFSNVWLNAVTGTGNTRFNLLIEIIAIIFYCTYTYIVLEKLNLSITWGWASEWLYWTLIFISSFIYMRSGKWKNKVV
jgi:multidrug resistance protein, MATE family